MFMPHIMSFENRYTDLISYFMTFTIYVSWKKLPFKFQISYMQKKNNTTSQGHCEDESCN